MAAYCSNNYSLKTFITCWGDRCRDKRHKKHDCLLHFRCKISETSMNTEIKFRALTIMQSTCWSSELGVPVVQENKLCGIVVVVVVFFHKVRTVASWFS